MNKKAILGMILAFHVNVFSNGVDAMAEAKADAIMQEELSITTRHLTQLKFQTTTMRALDQLFLSASKELRDQGFDQEALRLESEWRDFQSTSVGALDLGDHRPLSAWLVGRYEWLESKLGATIMHASRLDDIKIFNFAIPVVYSPASNAWTREEYQQHFVPYMAASVYWTARGSCGLALSFPASLICSPSASVIRHVTSESVAPTLSDLVHRVANR